MTGGISAFLVVGFVLLALGALALDGGGRPTAEDVTPQMPAPVFFPLLLVAAAWVIWHWTQ